MPATIARHHWPPEQQLEAAQALAAPGQALAALARVVGEMAEPIN